YRGISRTAALARVLVVLSIVALLVVVVAIATSGEGSTARLGGVSALTRGGVYGTLQAAALLFFAFAGYARIATLGEEVREPARTIPRAIPIALGITLAVYALVTVAVGLQLGGEGLATSSAPLADAVREAGHPGIEPVIRAGA